MILNGRFGSRLTPGVSAVSIVLLGAWTAVSLTSAAVGGDEELHGHPHLGFHVGELKLVHEDMAQRASIEFVEAHPTADVDGDGLVTGPEKGAYFTALALLDPEAVLEKFPFLDADEDGELSSVEIAHGLEGRRHRMIKTHLGKLAELHRRPVIQKKRSHGGLAIVQGDGEFPHPQHGELEFFGHRMGFNAARRLHTTKALAHWLVQNIEDTPTQDEVSEVLTELEAVRAAAFLARHPEADLDEDGTISDDEHMQFELARVADHRARLLERFPEADLDEDGILSENELEQFEAARVAQHLAELLQRHPEIDVDGDGVLSKEELVHFKLQQIELKEADRKFGHRVYRVKEILHEED